MLIIEDRGLLLLADAALQGIEIYLSTVNADLIGTVQPLTVITINKTVPFRHRHRTTNRVRCFHQQHFVLCENTTRADLCEDSLTSQLLMSKAALRHSFNSRVKKKA